MQEIWILPTNNKYFDIIGHFKETNILYWKKTKNICKGDLVYIYLARPYKCLKYKCVVLDDNINKQFIEENASYAITDGMLKILGYCKLELIQTFDDDKYTMEKLRENGLGQFQVLSRASRDLKVFFNTCENG